jgi:hypothetical protein
MDNDMEMETDMDLDADTDSVGHVHKQGWALKAFRFYK